MLSNGRGILRPSAVAGLVTSGVGPATTTLSPNSGYANVAPRSAPLVGAANFGGTVTNTSREFLSQGFKWRIRQSGTIAQVRLYVPSLAMLTGFYVKIWRKSGSTYNLVGASENLIDRIVDGVLTTITLTSPITGVQWGDFYSYRLEWASGCVYSNLCANTGVGNVTTYYVSNTTPSATAFAWESQTALAGTEVSIGLYMIRPVIVAIGDSMMCGGMTYEENGSIDTYQWSNSTADYFAGALGVTYQNVAIGGEAIQTRAARFQTDVVDYQPKIALLSGGTAGVWGSTTTAQFKASWTTMLDLCVANNIVPVCFLIYPGTYFPNAQQTIVDSWNAWLITKIATYPTAIMVDTRVALGWFRSGGAANNLWDFTDGLLSGTTGVLTATTGVTSDLLHISNTGRRVAALVALTAFLQTKVI